jgi:uncharacterized protein YqgC (DUF456 family)
VVELLTLVAVGLLAAGVVGSVVPVVPGPLFSLGGVYLYWWSTGYAEPGLLVLVGFTLVGVFAIAVDLLAGAMSARAGGASTTSSLAAGVAGFALFFVAGPVGIVVGVGGTVFLIEFLRGGDADESGRAAFYAAVGVLASGVVQALLTLSMLVGFLLVLWI